MASMSNRYTTHHWTFEWQTDCIQNKYIWKFKPSSLFLFCVQNVCCGNHSFWVEHSSRGTGIDIQGKDTNPHPTWCDDLFLDWLSMIGHERTSEGLLRSLLCGLESLQCPCCDEQYTTTFLKTLACKIRLRGFGGVWASYVMLACYYPQGNQLASGVIGCRPVNLTINVSYALHHPPGIRQAKHPSEPGIRDCLVYTANCRQWGWWA